MIRLKGPETITVPVATSAAPYTLCPADATADLVCDPGVASAVDSVEGDLLAVGLVTACQPSSYLATAGLAACTHIKLDTAGKYTITFSVANSDVRSRQSAMDSC